MSGPPLPIFGRLSVRARMSILVMPFSLAYATERFLYRIFAFFHDWYVGGFRAIGGRVVIVLESMDRTWALGITLRNILKPLYGDQSFIGLILGFLFRLGRVFVAGSLYLVVVSIGLCVYLAWASIPLYIIFKGFIKA